MESSQNTQNKTNPSEVDMSTDKPQVVTPAQEEEVKQDEIKIEDITSQTSTKNSLKDASAYIDASTVSLNDLKVKPEFRRVSVPLHRITPLKKNWQKIVTTIVENMKLQIRMNVRRKCVELRTSQYTADRNAVQKCVEFLKAFFLGFDLNDAIALLRLDDLFLDTFMIKDVKQTLKGDHLSRAVARISGERGKTKNAIENATRTRIVLANTTIHLMGSFTNIRVARKAICSLIMGSPAGKIYNQLKYISRRNKEAF